ncbi:MAG TPA: chemotaxis protein CheB [Verrucomicrobiae bacterium]|nr:chemotaxis protein CheB [Verrucomicrobiae bacterium]
MKVLIAEDDPVSSTILEGILSRAGYAVVTAADGREALGALRRERFDVLLTDWMMPLVDGIELVRRVRRGAAPQPVILMITAVSSPAARDRAMSAGADDYLAKPIATAEVVTRIAACLARREEAARPLPVLSRSFLPPSRPRPAGRPPYVGVVIAASTGGPPLLADLFAAIPSLPIAAFFVTLHGPAWMLGAFAERLGRLSPMPVRLAASGMPTRGGEVYVAPGDRHLAVDPTTLGIRLLDDPPESFVRPAADPLFRSAARAFGAQCLAVVLSGMGRDGAAGAAEIREAGGVVLVQDPATALAPSMPRGVLELGLATSSLGPALLPGAIALHASRLAARGTPAAG